MTKSRMDMLAKEARRIYCRFMRNSLHTLGKGPSNYGASVLPQYDGTSSERPRPGEAVLHRYGKDFKPVWPKIAKAAVAGGVTLLELIRSQFDYSAFGPPSANSCYSPRAISVAVGRRSSSRQELFNLLNSYKKVVSLNMAAASEIIDKPGVYVDVILSSDVSPFYKINTLMFIDESADVDQSAYKAAVDEYLLRIDLFESVWSKWTHAKFRDTALNSLRKERTGLQITTEEVVL